MADEDAADAADCCAPSHRSENPLLVAEEGVFDDCPPEAAFCLEKSMRSAQVSDLLVAAAVVVDGVGDLGFALRKLKSFRIA